MQNATKRTLRSMLLVGGLTCVGYLAAQQGPTQQSKETQSIKPQSSQIPPQPQPNNPSPDRLGQLETQAKDLRVAIDSLRTVRAQDREDINEVLRTVSRDENRIDKMGQQVGKITFDLDRVKAKVGLY